MLRDHVYNHYFDDQVITLPVEGLRTVVSQHRSQHILGAVTEVAHQHTYAHIDSED